MFDEKRHFRRYPVKIDTFLMLNDTPLKAQIIDYSLEGVGAIIHDVPQQIEDEILHCDTDNPVLKCPGRVVRAEKSGAGIRIGIRKLGDLKGKIPDYRFSDILMGMQRSQITGLYRFTYNDLVKTLYIKNGDMIFSASNRNEDRLADMLYHSGKIAEFQYIHAVAEMKRTGQRGGEVLVRLGYITHRELFKAVRRQVEEIILSIFNFEDGIFELIQSPLPKEEVITLNMSTANLIYQGIKRVDNFNVLRSELPSMESVLYFASDPVNLFQDIRLDDAGKKVLSSIDNNATVMDIIAKTNLDRLEALKTICALLGARIITVMPVISPIDDVIEGIGEDMYQDIDPDLRDIIEEMYSKYKRLGYYGVLEIGEQAPISDIKRAYYRAAKMYHPDMHHYIKSYSVKRKLSDIFSYIYEAYETLSNPQTRGEYDKSIYIKHRKR